MDRTYLFCPISEWKFLLEENLNRKSDVQQYGCWDWHIFRKLSCAAKKWEIAMKATYYRSTPRSTYRSTFRSCTKSDLKSPSSEPTSSSKASSKGSSRSPWASQDQEWEERERENKLHSSSFYSSIIWNITVIPSSKIYIELEEMQKSVKYWNRQNIEDSTPA